MSKSQAPSLTSPPQPRPQRPNRYATKAPYTVRLSIADLLIYVPRKWIREENWDGSGMVELPCEEIFQSHIPRISVDRLRRLVPQMLNVPEDVAATTKVLLPTTRLALAYHPSTGQKELSSSPLKQVPIPKLQEEAEETPLESDAKRTETTKLLASFPVLTQKPIPAVPQTSVELTPSSKSQTLLTAQRSPLPHKPLVAHLAKKAEEQTPSAVLGKQDFTTPLAQPLLETLPNENELQALLLTDERLSIHRVLDLCGQLPGVHTCTLTREWAVVAASQMLEGPDLVALSSHAYTLLNVVRETSEKMGLGAIGAITLFSSNGPVSLLRDRDLCLLILHKDKERGFMPGVREKLQAILAKLHKSRLPLPIEPSKTADPLTKPESSSLKIEPKHYG